MAFRVKAVFEDGSSKIVKYSDSYEDAILCVLAIADQRTTYAAPLPLLTTVQLMAGDHVAFDMRIERNEIGAADGEAGRVSVEADDARTASSRSWTETNRSKLDQLLSGNVILLSAHRPPVSALDLLARWEPSRPDEAGFHSGLDNPSNTVRVMGSGIWRESHADRYFDQQHRIVDQARRRFGPLKVLFDVRNWVVENSQSALQFQDVNAALYRPEDRLVAVVRSATDKKHPRTALRGKNTEVFTSLNAAETWLHAAHVG